MQLGEGPPGAPAAREAAGATHSGGLPPLRTPPLLFSEVMLDLFFGVVWGDRPHGALVWPMSTGSSR